MRLEVVFESYFGVAPLHCQGARWGRCLCREVVQMRASERATSWEIIIVASKKKGRLIGRNAS